MSARGRKNIVILRAENMFRMVANGGHEGHESKGSHRDKLKSVESVTSDVYKNISLRMTGIYFSHRIERIERMQRLGLQNT